MSIKSVFLLLIFMSNGTYLVVIFGVRKHRIILKGLLSLPGMIKVCLVIFWDCSLSYIIIFKFLSCCIIWALEHVWLQGKENCSICFRNLLSTIEGNHRGVSFMQYSKSSRYVESTETQLRLAKWQEGLFHNSEKPGWINGFVSRCIVSGVCLCS